MIKIGEKQNKEKEIRWVITMYLRDRRQNVIQWEVNKSLFA